MPEGRGSLLYVLSCLILLPPQHLLLVLIELVRVVTPYSIESYPTKAGIGARGYSTLPSFITAPFLPCGTD